MELSISIFPLNSKQNNGFAFIVAHKNKTTLNLVTSMQATFDPILCVFCHGFCLKNDRRLSIEQSFEQLRHFVKCLSYLLFATSYILSNI